MGTGRQIRVGFPTRRRRETDPRPRAPHRREQRDGPARYTQRPLRGRSVQADRADAAPSGGLAGAQLQQIRWPPSNIAESPGAALSRLFALPGSRYSDPKFSWKSAVPPDGIGFLASRALGPQYARDLFGGAATPLTRGGHLFRFNLTGNRRRIAVDDPRLEDRVADNTVKNHITESESLLFGSGFGVGTDIETGPNGNLFVVPLSHGVVYEIFKR
jgi:aldose sugar dehydrogenase